MTPKTTFHLSQNTFDAIVERGKRDIIVKRRDLAIGDRVIICSDDQPLAIAATIDLVEHSKNPKHSGTMVIVIKEVEATD